MSKVRASFAFAQVIDRHQRRVSRCRGKDQPRGYARSVRIAEQPRAFGQRNVPFAGRVVDRDQPHIGAAQLGIAPGTFKSRIARGRTRLRALIEERSTPLLADRTGRDTLPSAAKRPIHLRKRRDWRGVKIG